MAEEAEKGGGKGIAILGALLLLGSYLISLYQIHQTNVEQYDPDTRVIRIVHWHLESGVRETLDAYIDEYESMRASDGVKVKIVQLPIADRGYLQFVRTNMIGETLPDLVEWGRFHNPHDILEYFRPLTRELSEPNPYNEGTELEGVPWRETFFDSLRFAFVRELHDYYSVGFSAFTIRLFYNKDLLQKATGSDEAPRNYEAFLDACEKVEAYAEAHGEPIHPISSSAHALGMFEENLVPTIIGNLAYDLDYSLDGNLTLQEKLYGFLNESYDFKTDKELRYSSEIVTRLTKYFTPGFMAVKRDESVRQFLQGKAVFYTSGSWDIPSLQFNTPFRLGVAHFPFPNEKHPKYGPYFDGPPSEAETRTGFAFGLAKNSEHPDEATRFLQYLTSLEVNQEFNRDLQWIPSIRGAEVDEFLKPFLPNAEGSVNPWLFSLLGASGRVFMLRQQVFWPLASGESGYEEYADRLEKDYIDAATHDLFIQDENNRRGEMQADRGRWLFLFQEMSEKDPERAARAHERFVVSTEALYHSSKDTMVNRMKYNELLEEGGTDKVEQFRDAVGLAEGEEYVP